MEARWFESGRDGLLGLQLLIVGGFSLGRWEITDGAVQAAVVEPGHPFQGGQLDRVAGFPWAPAVDQFRLVEAVDGLCQRVVVAVPRAAHGGLDAGLGEALAVTDRHVLRPAIAVVDQTRGARRA